MKTIKTSQKALLKVINHYGSQKAVAHHLNISQQAINKWLSNKVPASRVLSICKLMKGSVTPEDLRPDLYGEDTIELLRKP